MGCPELRGVRWLMSYSTFPCIGNQHLIVYCYDLLLYHTFTLTHTHAHTHTYLLLPHNTDIDECATNNGGCSQGCNNTAGSFECTCTSGYELSDDGRTCIDIDECSTRMLNCQQVCVNTDGGFRCECDEGYQLNGDGTTCSGMLIMIVVWPVLLWKFNNCRYWWVLH